MDIIEVFIIIGRGWTKSKVIQDLRGEGYKHYFFFIEGYDDDILEKNMNRATEVWTFGDCIGYNTFKLAQSRGKDIWKMG